LLDVPQRVVAEFLYPTSDGSGLRRGARTNASSLDPSAAQ